MLFVSAIVVTPLVVVREDPTSVSAAVAVTSPRLRPTRSYTTLGDVTRTAAVGADVRVTLRGFPAGRRVQIHLVPTIHRGGNCCGIEARLRRGRRTNAGGRAVARFRWPAHYLRCGGASGCERVRWTQGQRVDVLVVVANVRRTRVIRLIP
jgi:hypothetical protein